MTTDAIHRTPRHEFRDDWPLLLSAMMGVGLASMIPYSIGVFIGPMRQELGWSADIILLGFSFISVVGALSAPFSGHFILWFGARGMALAGTVILAAGTAALAAVPQSIPTFFAIYLVIAIGHGMVSAIIWQKLIVERYVVVRGLAVSIALCGSNIAGAISPMLATVVIEYANWRVGYLALASYMFISTFPLAWFFFRERAVDRAASTVCGVYPKIGLTPSQAWRTREFWLMCISFGFAGIGITGYIVHFVPMLRSQGFSLLLAASVVSSLSIAALIGRLVTGAFMDRVFAPRLAFLALSLPMVSSALLLVCAPNYWVALVAAIFLGLSTGAEFNMIAYLTTRYFGLKDYGTIGGIFYGVFMAGCLAGQQVPALLLRWGSYNWVITLFGTGFLIAATAMLFCRPYPRPDAFEAIEETQASDPMQHEI